MKLLLGRFFLRLALHENDNDFLFGLWGLKVLKRYTCRLINCEEWVPALKELILQGDADSALDRLWQKKKAEIRQ